MIGLRTLKGFPSAIATAGADATQVRLSSYADGSLEIDKAGHLIGCWEPWERLDCIQRFTKLATQLTAKAMRTVRSTSGARISSGLPEAYSDAGHTNQAHQDDVALAVLEAAGTCAYPTVDGSSGEQRMPIRVLLVEDHADTAQALAQLLKFFGYDARIATTANEAMALSQQEPFDVIISDLTLPDITGRELMQAIRERSTMPGIALSGLSGNDEADLSREAGFCDHLVKPIDMDVLHASIQRVTSIQRDLP